MIKMVSITQLRGKIDAKIFTGLGSTMLVSSIGTSTNTRGDLVSSFGTASSVVGVPYNLIKSRQGKEVFGDIQEGDMVCVFKYDQVIDVGYKVSFKSVNYNVVQVEDFPLLDEYLVKSVLLRKNLP
jgi:hypothetical protein